MEELKPEDTTGKEVATDKRKLGVGMVRRGHFAQQVVRESILQGISITQKGLLDVKPFHAEVALGLALGNQVRSRQRLKRGVMLGCSGWAGISPQTWASTRGSISGVCERRRS